MDKKKLRIAQLVLPWLPIPPKGYGGTEVVVHYITEELVKRGHDVTLFSVGDSTTSARLEKLFPQALGLQDNVSLSLASNLYPIMHVANCFEKQSDFDIIHSHAQFLGLPFSAVAKTPTVHTFHRQLNNLKQDEEELISHYRDLNYTSISDSQRVEGLNYIKTVYNGINSDIFNFVGANKQDYLMWAGRLIDKKGPVEAIEVAEKLNMPLIMVGTVTEQMYFEEMIEPHLKSNSKIKLLGNLEQAELVKIYQEAKVLLMPIKWNEPFGLTAAEAMSCGTPVVAFGEGAIPEVLKDGETGFIINLKDHSSQRSINTPGVEGLVEGVKKILDLPENEYAKLREDSRKHLEENFTVEKMVDGYEDAYGKILGL